MLVAWEERRWFRIVHMVLRWFRSPAASQGALRIQVDEPQALGRMLLEDPEGKVLYALIDCNKNRKKWFYLPVSAVEGGFVLRSEKGETLFSLPAGGKGPAGRNDGQTPDESAADTSPWEPYQPMTPDQNTDMPPPYIQSTETQAAETQEVETQTAYGNPPRENTAPWTEQQ